MAILSELPGFDSFPFTPGCPDPAGEVPKWSSRNTFSASLMLRWNKGPRSNTAIAPRDRLRCEVENLVGSIVAGVPTDTVTTVIRKQEVERAVRGQNQHPQEQPT